MPGIGIENAIAVEYFFQFDHALAFELPRSVDLGV